MTSNFSGFSPDAIKFLRALKRNNRRDWFQPRKEKYEALIKAPMLEFAAALNEEFARFAPAYVTPPEKAVYRIYRDTRFSPDKTPYKTHIAAIFPRHTAVKREGAVFYLHFTEKELLAFGGVWGPDRDELMAYRSLLRDNHEEFDAILAEKSLRKAGERPSGRAAKPHAQRISRGPSRGGPAAAEAVVSGIHAADHAAHHATRRPRAGQTLCRDGADG
jgi:uncharacterized protein (TIGR02453 family)